MRQQQPWWMLAMSQLYRHFILGPMEVVLIPCWSEMVELGRLKMQYVRAIASVEKPVVHGWSELDEFYGCSSTDFDSTNT